MDVGLNGDYILVQLIILIAFFQCFILEMQGPWIIDWLLYSFFKSYIKLNYIGYL